VTVRPLESLSNGAQERRLQAAAWVFVTQKNHWKSQVRERIVPFCSLKAPEGCEAVRRDGPDWPAGLIYEPRILGDSLASNVRLAYRSPP